MVSDFSSRSFWKQSLDPAQKAGWRSPGVRACRCEAVAKAFQNLGKQMPAAAIGAQSIAAGYYEGGVAWQAVAQFTQSPIECGVDIEQRLKAFPIGLTSRGCRGRPKVVPSCVSLTEPGRYQIPRAALQQPLQRATFVLDASNEA